jgi:hypothetical protein
MATIRGSEKVLEQLFGDPKIDSKQLASAVEQAQQVGLRFDRLWWKGQPHPDLIRATTRLGLDQFASTIGELIKLHNSTNQLSFEVFPKGVVQIDAIDVDITVNRNIGG